MLVFILEYKNQMSFSNTCLPFPSLSLTHSVYLTDISRSYDLLPPPSLFISLSLSLSLLSTNQSFRRAQYLKSAIVRSEEERNKNATQSSVRSDLINISIFESIRLKQEQTSPTAMMKFFVMIILFAFILLEPQLVLSRSTGLDESNWWNSFQDQRSNHQLIKRKGQPGRRRRRRKTHLVSFSI